MFIERFLQFLQFEKRFSFHTVNAYKTDLQQFKIFLTSYEVPIHEATHNLIRSWMVELLENNAEAKTINRKISTLRSYYKFLLREGLIQNNPTSLVQAPKIAKRLPVVVEEQKMDRLLDCELFP